MTQQEIDQAIKNQIDTDPFEDLPSNPDIAQALANYAATAAGTANVLNAALTANYQTAFSNWSALVLAGKIPNTTPPQPPMGYVAVRATDGWTYVVRGVDAVCAMPAIPSIPQPTPNQVVAIGSHLSGNWWAALPAQANVPSGFTTPEPVTTLDHTVGRFTWVAYPFGGWWEKVG